MLANIEEHEHDPLRRANTIGTPQNIRRIGKLNLRTGTGWRPSLLIFCGPPGPYDFPGKISKIFRTGDFSPFKMFGGGLALVREFDFPAGQKLVFGII